MTNSKFDSFNSIPIEQIKGITDKNIDKFKKNLKIHSLGELVMHLPINYEDKTTTYLLSEVILGNKSNIKILVQRKFVRNSAKRFYLSVVGVDEEGSTCLINFYNRVQYFDNLLSVGKVYLFFGQVLSVNYVEEQFLMQHPQVFDLTEDDNVDEQATLSPIYSTTKGLLQSTLRKIINNGLSLINDKNFEELMPKSGYPKIPIGDELGNLLFETDINNLLLSESLKKIHNPPLDVSVYDLKAARQPWLLRLIAEELLAKTLLLLKAKQETKKIKSVNINCNINFLNAILQTLPFSLTNAQTQALRDVIIDLNKDTPMLRLVQGDVGSGKTMIAVLAAALVVKSGYQVCLMAPTDILATQLASEVAKVLTPFGINVGLVNGKLKTRERREIASQIKSGAINVVVGTHALYSDWVEFNNLGLAIVDEQHRFGVEQRLKLSFKQPKFKIHFLMMSATPAPRSIAMTVYASLDLSVIDELPPGRTPIQTSLISQNSRLHLIERIHYQIKTQNRQVYWVCCLVDDSEVINAQSAIETFILLCNELPDIRIGLVHGKMKDDEKDIIMQRFKNHELDMLVATTVIEVGVNVPNASIMVIENPERLGLSQIHQLRGRVGRGTKDSYCILLYGSHVRPQQIQRLNIFKHCNNGFVIAENDMKTRGSGDIIGTAQSGTISFMVADLSRDNLIAQVIYPFAKDLLIQEPELAQKIIKRWLPYSNNLVYA